MAGALLLASSMTSLAALVPAGQASAQTATTWQDANFQTFGTGSEIHLKALGVGNTTVAELEQAFSGQSVYSKGLTKPLNAQTGMPIQPAFASSPTVNAYGRGTGLEVGLATTKSTNGKDPNQVLLPGLAESQSPPLSGPVHKSLLPLHLDPVLKTDVINGNASSAYDPNVCTLGQPLAYGEGDAAKVGLLSLPGQPPLLSTTGPDGTAGVAQSQTYSYLVANGDGTFGVASVTKEILVPITLNLSTLASVTLTVQGSAKGDPITLLATADGQGHAKVELLNASPTLTVSITLLGTKLPDISIPITNSPITFPASLGLAAALANPITQPLNDLLTQLNLAKTVAGISQLLAKAGIGALATSTPPILTVGGPIKAIPGFGTSGPTTAAGSYDLATVNLSAAGLGTLADLRIGHMEAGAFLEKAFTCSIPVNKTANPMSVAAGNQFTWNISIPTDAHSLDVQACDLTHISAVDKIGVFKGNPKFQVVSVSNGGSYDAASQTITWSDLGAYKPGSPPIILTITVNVPADSPAGILQDTVNVASGVGNCTGGATANKNLNGDLSKVKLAGSFTLNAPTVTTTAALLAHTGGGTTMAWLGGGLLVLAEGARRVLRRARRPEATSTTTTS
jgi:hypothetical protein